MLSRQSFKPICSFFTALAIAIVFTNNINAQAGKKDESFTVENYYKIKWGYAEEFIDLWKKNHYPLLKKAIQKGDIISVVAEKPKLHSGEDTRWDFKVILVFKMRRLHLTPTLRRPIRKNYIPILISWQKMSNTVLNY
ncbi:MAG: hypothetical protein WDO19_22225 [Bacteroidota bacterium]